MMKFCRILCTTFILICIACPSFAARQLKNPQGRVSSGYKTEPYRPLTKTNITAKELEKISSIVKQGEQHKKKEKVSNGEKIVKVKQEKQVKEIKNKQNIAKIKKEKPVQNKLVRSKQKETNIDENKSKKSVAQNTQVQPKSEPKVQTVATKTVSTQNNNKDYETRRIINEINSELAADREQMLEELSALWVSAVQKSDTVYFAIMKLSNPNGGEVNKNGFKKILEPIISAAPLVGQAFVNPALTAGSLIGSNVMGTMMNDGVSKRLTRVNDADLVILARAIDELQETLLTNYMSYKNSYKEYELAIKIASDRKKTYDNLNKQNSPQLVLASTFYTEALDNQYKARQNFLMKRIVLEQMVGVDALHEIENKTSELSAINDL